MGAAKGPSGKGAPTTGVVKRVNTVHAARKPAQEIQKRSPDAAREAAWLPPLQRHVRPDGSVEYVTVRVRVLSGDTDHDFNAKFPDGPIEARDITDVIAAKEGLTSLSAALFSLWIVGKDLEIQLQPDMDIFVIMCKWYQFMMQYAHFPEASNPNDSINRHWFIYRREASLSRQLEITCKEDVAIKLLYGEAKRNIHSGRWPCSIGDAISLAALQLQSISGDYHVKKNPHGYLSRNDAYKNFIPRHLHGKLKPSKWEAALTMQYKENSGFSQWQCLVRYLDLVRQWPCYGTTQIPCCFQSPPFGFFEFRRQNMTVCINYEGVCIVDVKRCCYKLQLQWGQFAWKASPDTLALFYKKSNGRKKCRLIYTPQASFADAILSHIRYLRKNPHEAVAKKAIQEYEQHCIKLRRAQMGGDVDDMANAPHRRDVSMMSTTTGVSGTRSGLPASAGVGLKGLSAMPSQNSGMGAQAPRLSVIMPSATLPEPEPLDPNDPFSMMMNLVNATESALASPSGPASPLGNAWAATASMRIYPAANAERSVRLSTTGRPSMSSGPGGLTMGLPNSSATGLPPPPMPQLPTGLASGLAGGRTSGKVSQQGSAQGTPAQQRRRSIRPEQLAHLQPYQPPSANPDMTPAPASGASTSRRLSLSLSIRKRSPSVSSQMSDDLAREEFQSKANAGVPPRIQNLAAATAPIPPKAPPKGPAKWLEREENHYLDYHNSAALPVEQVVATPSDARLVMRMRSFQVGNMPTVVGSTDELSRD